MMGIYKITDLNNKIFYIGSSVNIYSRWKRHLNQLKNKNHCNFWLQKIYDKYGEKNLLFEVIEECANLKEKEQYYIDTLNPKININKCSTGGDMISNHPLKKQIRKKQLENTRKAAKSELLKQKRKENAKKQKPNGPMAGLKHSLATKNKMSQKRGTKIQIDGITFNSLRKASEYHNTNHHTILNRALSSNFPNYILF